ncbi:SixA phosphatase family protein [Robertkochia solimangrovi]|uniref:SixA phosphatase family protein n=1 Tax=Robertkochia solimangrovi TaxID=2213046 RepID=UPI00117E5DA6|nr:histidine phosphatase family protein [Robertkochia solimangrovi]TRZ42883.1 histidine phosphatase family protein [Robertkochia solimangrovi]
MNQRTLTLMRHGKSSWDAHVNDIDRPLQERGILDAARVGAYVKDRIPMPQQVYSSPANRALHTCVIMMRTLHLPFEHLLLEDELYDFGGSKVESFIRSIDDGIESVMIFGHNDAFTSISNIFGNEMIDNLPTAGLVHIRFEAESWRDLKRGETELTVFPKLLR